MIHKKNIHYHIIKHLREMHRLIGIWIALFLIFLAFTGILINHGNALSLDSSHVKHTFLLDHYGVKPPSSLKKYALINTLPKQHIYVVDDQVWYKQKLLVDSQQKVVTVGCWLEFIIVVTSNKLYLFTDQAELIDILDSVVGLPTNINNAAVLGGSVYLHTSRGTFLSRDQFESWQRVDFMPQAQDDNLKLLTITLPEKQQLSLLHRQQMLSWERVILDMHSGRLFGQIGVLLMDFIAILIIVLSLSGVYIWVRQARAKRR